MQHPSIAYGGLSGTNLHKQANSSITMEAVKQIVLSEKILNLEGTSTCPPTRTHLPEERLTALRRTAVASDGAVVVGVDGGVRSSCVRDDVVDPGIGGGTRAKSRTQWRRRRRRSSSSDLSWAGLIWIAMDCSVRPF